MCLSLMILILTRNLLALMKMMTMTKWLQEMDILEHVYSTTSLIKKTYDFQKCLEYI